MPVIDERKRYILGFQDSVDDKCVECAWTTYDEMGHIYCSKVYYVKEKDKEENRYLGGTSLYGCCEHFENNRGEFDLFKSDSDW